MNATLMCLGLIFCALISGCGVDGRSSDSSNASVTSSSNSSKSVAVYSACPSEPSNSYLGVPPSLPQKVEAEDYDIAGFSDSSDTNEGGEYRDDSVDIKKADSGYAVGWMTSGEWLEYTVYVKSEGDFDVTIRSGATELGRTLDIIQCGQVLLDNIDVPLVNEWGQFKTWSAGKIHLHPGYQKLRINLGDMDFMDLDWIYFGDYDGVIDPANPDVPAPTTFDNPIIKYDAADPTNGPGTQIFTADGAGMPWNGKLYLYTTHDEQYEGESGYRMFDYRLWVSSDMVHWENKGAVARYNTWTWARGSDSAGDANAMQTVHRKNAQGQDKFYIYVPINGDPSGWGITIGVGVADKPEGPFTDPRGMPMILLSDTAGVWKDDSGKVADHGWRNLDPTVFVDDDGRAYMYWGNNALYWVELESDMIHLKGETYTLDGNGNMQNRNTSNVKVHAVNSLPDFEEAAYLHKRGDWYYLSYSKGFPESTAYGMSRSPEGPWEYKGTILDSQSIPKKAGTVHHSIFEFNGASYMSYHNAGLPSGGEYRRSVCLDRIYYNTDGTIKKLIPTAK